MTNEPIHELTKAIAAAFGLSFIGYSSGSLEPEQRPFPWVSFFPAGLREKPEKFLLLLGALGEWNRCNPAAQWVYRPEEASNQTLFSVYCLLEPLRRNDERSEEILTQLRNEAVQLAQYLARAGKPVIGTDESRLAWLYPRPSSGDEEAIPDDELGVDNEDAVEEEVR